MAKKDNDETTPSVDSNARLVTTDEDKAKAAKWFARGRELGEKRQFDHAIEYYVNGLEFWPDAVEEACKSLHGCAVARKQTGGKKPGLKDTMRRSTNDKDPKQAYLNALWLFGHEPDNVGYIEAVMRTSSRLRAEDAAKWAGGVLYKTLETNTKAGPKQFLALIQLYEELGDRATSRNDIAYGVSVYQAGVEALQLLRRRVPKDAQAEAALKTLSTKLTILKGQYQEGESYRGSIVDAELQADIHDQQRTVQGDDRVDQLVVKAEAEYQQNPTAVALKSLVDMLCRRERTDEETRAIGHLVQEYKKSGEYRWKMTADDIRMKQLGRDVREAEKSANAEVVKAAQVAQLRFELSTFKDRVERYPTDHRAKFEYGVRKFRAGQYDDAIPMFQAGRSDAKNRAACGMYLGRCFFRKGYFSQSVAALQEAIAGHEFQDDDLAKTMRYWLGRSQEGAGEREAARRTYGDLLTLDYNYKDVRARLDDLSGGG